MTIALGKFTKDESDLFDIMDMKYLCISLFFKKKNCVIK